MGSLKFFFKLMKGNTLLYVGAILSVAVATVFSLITPLIIKFTIDSVIEGKPIDLPIILINFIESIGGVTLIRQNLWILSIGIVTVTAFQGVFSYLKGRWSATAAENIARDLKNRLYSHLQNLPYEYHVKAQTGDLIQRCTSDVDTIRRFLTNQVIEVVRSLLIVIFSVVILLNLNVKLTLIAIITIPFIFITSFIFFLKIKKQFLLVDEKEGELSTVLQENLSGVRVVRAFGRQKFETEKFEAKNSEFKVKNIYLCKLLAYFWSCSDILSLSQVGIVLFAGVYMAVNGEISLGTLIVFTAYENMLVWPVRNMGRVLGDMGKMQVSLGRVNEILFTPKEEDTSGAISPDLKGDLVFDHVKFEYEKNKPILNGLSFSIQSGETIAILGSTGSGKSTIMHLLLRLYDYQSGSIKVNGTELRNINKKWLREKVGVVLQEPFLYSKTIKDNLKMARANVGDTEIFEATRTASVHEVIEKFESGYETIVGEKGVTLSGGQKQRVAIARTLIKDCDILIFDDSLSAVDTETDSQIRQALKERSKDVTTFIISQRITTLMEADRIFIIENGKVSDIGTHNDLIKREGLYSRIWAIQAMLEEETENL